MQTAVEISNRTQRQEHKTVTALTSDECLEKTTIQCYSTKNM